MSSTLNIDLEKSLRVHLTFLMKKKTFRIVVYIDKYLNWLFFYVIDGVLMHHSLVL